MAKAKTKAQRAAAALDTRVDEEELGSDSDEGEGGDAELLPIGAWPSPAPASPITPAPGTRKTLRKPKPPPAPLPAASKAVDAQGSLTGKGLEEGVRVTSWRMSRLLKATPMSKAAAERLWVRNEANDVAVDAEGSVIEPQWKKMSTDLMRKYAMVVSGSTIEDNGMQVEFSFKNADPEWGCVVAPLLHPSASSSLSRCLLSRLPPCTLAPPRPSLRSEVSVGFVRSPSHFPFYVLFFPRPCTLKVRASAFPNGRALRPTATLSRDCLALPQRQRLRHSARGGQGAHDVPAPENVRAPS
jgi:hypothetical protein